MNRDTAGRFTRYAAKPCCPWHSRTCEPPYEMCCTRCTERAHVAGTVHSDGSRCVLSPDDDSIHPAAGAVNPE